MSVNKVIILGRLGQDPELKYTPSGAAVCSFSLATSESWTDKSGQRQERTEWHRVVVWGKLAELCNQYLAKGRQAYVEGSLQTRQWEAQDGSKRYTTEINARTIQFIGGQAQAGQGQGQYQQQPQQQNNFGGGQPQQNFGGGQQQQAQPQQQNNMMDQEYEITTDASFTADDIPF